MAGDCFFFLVSHMLRAVGGVTKGAAGGECLTLVRGTPQSSTSKAEGSAGGVLMNLMSLARSVFDAMAACGMPSDADAIGDVC